MFDFGSGVFRKIPFANKKIRSAVHISALIFNDLTTIHCSNCIDMSKRTHMSSSSGSHQ